MAEAVNDGGGHVVPLGRGRGDRLGRPPRPRRARPRPSTQAPDARWVQLPFAGIENFVHLVDHDREWTCGKGVYAEPVAEMALTLALAGLRGFGTYARAHEWSAPQGRNLLGARVTILGGGGITESLVRLLQPFDCHITVVRRTAHHLDGVDDVLEADRYADALPGRRPRRARARADARDRGDHRRRRAVVDGATTPGSSTSPAAATSSPTTSSTRCATASSAAPASTSPIPSRCRTTTRCGRCRTASSRRTSATRRRWPSRCSPSASGPTSAASPTATSSSGRSTSTPGTDVAARQSARRRRPTPA